jgi:hypothetical protein
MVRGVASATDLTEELGYLTGKDVLVLEPAQEFILRFFRGNVEPNPRCHELGEEFGELAQFKKGGVGIFGKIPFSEHSQAQKLIIMFLKVREVAAKSRRFFHW